VPSHSSQSTCVNMNPRENSTSHYAEQVASMDSRGWHFKCYSTEAQVHYATFASALRVALGFLSLILYSLVCTVEHPSPEIVFRSEDSGFSSSEMLFRCYYTSHQITSKLRLKLTPPHTKIQPTIHQPYFPYCLLRKISTHVCTPSLTFPC